MKIVHIAISCFYIEGAGYQENLLPKAHRKAGHEVTMISSQYSFNSKGQVEYRPVRTYTNDNDVKVIILKDTPHLRLGLNMFKKKCYGLYKALENEHPDIIFMHGLSALDSYTVLRYLRKHPQVKFYADQHGDYYNTRYSTLGRFVLNFITRPMVKKIADRANKLWGTTPWRVEYMQDVYKVPAEKTDLLVMGADEGKIDWENKDTIRKAIRKQYDIDENDFLIITGGKVNRAKNIHLLADAIVALNRKDIKLLVFGSFDKEMEETFIKYADKENIVLAGWIKSDAAYNVFLAGDLVCFPGTHSVLWEQAVACGIPGIYQLWNGMKHVNVNDNAILIKDITKESIFNTIQLILSNKELYNKMKNNAEQAMTSFYYCDIARKAIEMSETHF